jgi:hypothetical protein
MEGLQVGREENSGSQVIYLIEETLELGRIQRANNS